MTQPNGEPGPAIVGLVCPIPTRTNEVCSKDLHVVWRMSRGLSLLDVAVPEPIEPGDAWVQDWTVECEDGHVLLVPDNAGCRHSDEEAEHPDHGTPGRECDVDSTDEYRTFRADDGARLAVVLARLNAGNLREPAEVRTDA